MSTLHDALDASFAAAWRPEPGDKLVGTVTELTERDGAYGPYPIITLRQEDGEEFAVHAFHGCKASSPASRRSPATRSASSTRERTKRRAITATASAAPAATRRSRGRSTPRTSRTSRRPTFRSRPARRRSRHVATTPSRSSPGQTEEAASAASSALIYAERGWPVFPLRGKVPYTANGLKDATTELARVDQWWQQTWPGANVGIRTGAGLLVLDVTRPTATIRCTSSSASTASCRARFKL